MHKELPHIPVKLSRGYLIFGGSLEIGDGSINLSLTDLARERLREVAGKYSNQPANQAIAKICEDEVNKVLQELHQQGHIEVV